jgi:hypothetical protein
VKCCLTIPYVSNLPHDVITLISNEVMLVMQKRKDLSKISQVSNSTHYCACRIQHLVFGFAYFVLPCVSNLTPFVRRRTSLRFRYIIRVEFDTYLFLSSGIWFICHTRTIRYTGTLCFVDLVYFQVLLHLVIGSTPTDFARLQIQIFENHVEGHVSKY